MQRSWRIELDASSTAPAWCLTSLPFGAQLIEGARIRSWADPATLCRHCGVARGVRPAPGERPMWVHRLWCPARTDPAHESWDVVDLVDERTVDAVRILVPVSRVDAEKRVTGFEAVILGGLARLGHPIDGLATTRTSTIDDAGTVRHFVVLHVSVPAGGSASADVLVETWGVLRWLADPTHLREVLLAASAAGLPGTTPTPAVGRLLHDVLEHGGVPTGVDSLDSVDLAVIERRELRDAFLDTLVLWAQRDPHAEIRRPIDATTEDASAVVFDLSITLEAQRHDYRVSTTATDTVTTAAPALDGVDPDVWITRSGGGVPTFAIALDHAEPPGQVQPTSMPIAGGQVVPIRWRLSRADIESFFAALGSSGELDVPGVALFDEATRAAIDAAQQSHGGVFSASALEQNPVALLLDVLARPSLREWQRLAAAAQSVAGRESAAPTGTAMTDTSAWRNIEELASIKPLG